MIVNKPTDRQADQKLDFRDMSNSYEIYILIRFVCKRGSERMSSLPVVVFILCNEILDCKNLNVAVKIGEQSEHINSCLLWFSSKFKDLSNLSNWDILAHFVSVL